MGDQTGDWALTGAAPAAKALGAAKWAHTEQQEGGMSGADEARTPKIRENRLRRMARRQGLVLRKSTMRDPRAPFYGTYGLVDPQTDKWVPWGGKGTVPPRDDSKGRKAGPTGVGGHAYGLTLDEIDTWLHTPRPVSASRPEGPWTHGGLTPEQIGRASCRERVFRVV